MPDVGIPELLIILVIVLVIFGPGRLAGTGGALGKAIKEFRQGLQGPDKQPARSQAEPAEESPGPTPPADATSHHQP